MDDEHPLRDVLMVAAFGAWAILCWQDFDWIVKYGNRKAETFCGKIHDYQTQTETFAKPQV